MEFFLILFLVCLSAIFSGGEIAFFSLSLSKIHEEKKKNNNSIFVKTFFKLKNNPDKFLITMLIGNNVVNIISATIVANYTSNKFGSEYLALSAGILTFVILVFAEIIPKSFCKNYALRVSIYLSIFFLFIQFLLFPFIIFFEKILYQFNKKQKDEITITEDEVRAMVDLGSQNGEIETHEKDFFENILKFSDKTVKEILIPESKIIAISGDKTIKDAIEKAIVNSLSRIPVFGKDLNKTKGLLILKEMLKLNQKDKNKKINDFENVLFPVMKVPETKKIKDIFFEFKKKRIHFAMVINEHGDLLGAVTMDDVLEEIVGDIDDETDNKKKDITKIEKNVFELDADIQLETVNKKLDINLCAKNGDYYRSIGYFILEKTGIIPSEGKTIKINNFIKIIVSEIRNNKIETVRIYLKAKK